MSDYMQQVRKLFLIAIVPLISNSNTFLKIAVGTIVSIGCTIFNVRCQPFSNPSLNLIITTTSIVESLYLFFCLLLASGSMDGADKTGAILFVIVVGTFFAPVFSSMYRSLVRRRALESSLHDHNIDSLRRSKSVPVYTCVSTVVDNCIENVCAKVRLVSAYVATSSSKCV